MEEIIKIAFSTLDSRVTSNENEIKDIIKAIDEFLGEIRDFEKRLLFVEKALDTKYLQEEKDQLEVYKFGE